MKTLLLATTALTPANGALRPIAYSLIRFSTPGQAAGDSYRRQFSPQQAFCDTRGWELDLSLHHTDIRKFAASAFKTPTKTPFVRFIAMVEAGVLPMDRQLILLIEEVDRAIRRIHSEAYDYCLRLMRCGVWICTTSDGEIYTLADINNDLGKRLKLQLKLDAAAEFSLKLQTRLKSVWDGRRERIEAGEVIPSEASPGWIDVVDGQYMLNPARTATTRNIHQLHRGGYGRRKIAQLLNDDLERHPTWRGTTWHPSAVQRILESRATFGEVSLRRNETDDEKAARIAAALAAGETPVDRVRMLVMTKVRYYPPVLAGPSGENGTFTDADYAEAEQLFNLAEAARTGRKHKGPLHKGNRVNNILPPAECTCEAFDKRGRIRRGTLVYVNKSDGNRYLACDYALRHVRLTDGTVCQNHRHYNHPALERVMLAILPSFDFTRLLTRPDPHSAETAGLEAEIATKKKRADWLREYGDMTADHMRTINKLAAEIGIARDRLSSLHKEVKIAEAEANHEAFAEFVALVTTMQSADPDDPECNKTRAAIAQELRRIVSVIRAEDDYLIAWMPAVAGWFRLGIKLSGRTFTSGAIIVEIHGAETRREEYPLSLRETATAPTDGTGWLEPYIDGNLATRLNALVVQKAAAQLGADPATELSRIRDAMEGAA